MQLIVNGKEIETEPEIDVEALLARCLESRGRADWRRTE